MKESREAVVQKAVANGALAVLTWREQQVLTLRQGLDGNKPLTLHGVAGMLAISRERVRQIEGRAIVKLHEADLPHNREASAAKIVPPSL